MASLSCGCSTGEGPWCAGPWGPMMPYGQGGFIAWFLLLIVIALVVYVFMRTYNSQPGREDSPLEILKRRYARGEITREDFESMKRDLVD